MQQPDGQPTFERLLTLKQAAEILDISKSSMYRMTDSRELPYVQLSKRMIDPVDLRAYITARKVRRLPKGLGAAST